MFKTARGNPPQNQQVIGNCFYSYNTLIAMKGDKVKLTEYWDYSATTLRYLKQFLGVDSKKEIEKGIKEGTFEVKPMKELVNELFNV